MAIPWNGILVLYSAVETSFELDCEGSVTCYRASFAEADTVTVRKAALRHCIYKYKLLDIFQVFCSGLVLFAIHTDFYMNRAHLTIKQSVGTVFLSANTMKLTILIFQSQLALRRPL